MHIPKTVKVGGHITEIELVNTIDNGKTSGMYIYRQDKILLAKKVSIDDSKKLIVVNKASMYATFLHELQHAIDFVYNSDGLPENKIDRLSEGLYQVIVDNPSIFEKGAKNNETRKLGS